MARRLHQEQKQLERWPTTPAAKPSAAWTHYLLDIPEVGAVSLMSASQLLLFVSSLALVILVVSCTIRMAFRHGFYWQRWTYIRWSKIFVLTIVMPLPLSQLLWLDEKSQSVTGLCRSPSSPLSSTAKYIFHFTVNGRFESNAGQMSNYCIFVHQHTQTYVCRQQDPDLSSRTRPFVSARAYLCVCPSDRWDTSSQNFTWQRFGKFIANYSHAMASVCYNRDWSRTEQLKTLLLTNLLTPIAYKSVLWPKPLSRKAQNRGSTQRYTKC